MHVYSIFIKLEVTECKQCGHLGCSDDFATALLQTPGILLYVHVSYMFLICHSNDVHIFLCEALSLLGEVNHHRKQSCQVEAEETFRICVQERLQGLVEHCVLGLVVIQETQVALHGVSYGFEQLIGAIQVSAGLLCCFTVPRLIRGYISQQARQEDGLLHVANS